MTDIFHQQELCFSNHALKRMKQRGLNQLYANIIFWFGTEIHDDGAFFFTRKNALEVLAHLERKITKKLDIDSKIAEQIIKTLVGWKLVVNGNKIITCYRCTSKRQQKRMSRLLN